MYIDDSGDAGFKFGSGSTSHLVMAAVVFRSVEDIQAAAEMIAGCRTMNRRTREFKYAKTRELNRACFFACCRPATYSVRAIVIDKANIYRPHLRENPSSLKSYAIMQLLTHTFGTVRDAKVFVDGEDTKAFGVEDKRYFRDAVNRREPGTIREVSFTDSKQNSMIQLADMTAGAINHAFRKNKPADATSLDSFRNRTWQPRGSIWHFR
ncbi:DUF3800 domain-containing protein [Rathayibacter sp. AY1D9]|uniref:DUF3800 domain-containing protein n=1 Tax=Rathayibacter sp. AY1D9 TaxID=2080548 RepID=UPI0015E2940C|nr:DUF3800 domain-containing protein [Rathayibacter sp. AY1D9]